MTKKKENTTAVTDATFEDAMQKLEDMVQKLEGGKLSLDESLQAFTEGMQMAAFCEKQLTAASGQVEKIMKDLSGHESMVLVSDTELSELKG